MTTKDDIRNWFDRGVSLGKDIMIVLCDPFDYEQYPIYTDAAEYEQKYQDLGNVLVSGVMRVYDLTQSKDVQLAEPRALHPEMVSNG
jgi:hypothetical protein